jgi:pimeloyl-ACP methyl ester carboxylesterase
MHDDEAADYDEFGLLEAYANFEGVPWRGRPAVRRESFELGERPANGAGDRQRLSAIVWGDTAPELVLLHGGGQNAHTWDSVALILDRPLVAIDLPGHGHSSWREDTDYSPESNAAAIAVAIERFAPSAKAVVGMSLGGLTTIRLAAARPDLVRRAVLVDITPGIVGRTKPLTEQEQGAVALTHGPSSYDSFQAMLEATAAKVPGRPIESLRTGVLHNSQRLADGRWAWRYDQRGHQAAAAAATAGSDDDRSARCESLWSDVSAISAPLMLVRGGRSAFVSDDDRAEFERRQPTARVHVADGAGHSVQSDRARLLAEHVAEFVDGG